ncbi:MAG: hypothetical protein DRP11_00495 [Candidatus Aenigmatarchaeota archaeon]|nr:MAG: hypothetical protein DRP11_00495 [Candidatus Aenigmarchaeota archaeon]
MKQKYIFAPNEKKIATVPRWVFLNMHRIARDLDLDKGGLYDSRGGGAINIWVSPEDHPEDWRWPIKKIALKYPRAYLAGIYPEYRKDGMVDLYLVITNYEREGEAEAKLANGEIDYHEYRRQVELARRGTEAEWKWALEKTNWLIEKAQGLGDQLEYYGFWMCPFCRHVIKTTTANERVQHIVEHGIKVFAVEITGDGVFAITERGAVKL